MAGLQLPEGMRFKIMVDTFQAYHNANRGLVAEDQIRIASDLEKIAKMPLISDHYEGDLAMTPVKLGQDGRSYALPLRTVKVLCDASFGSGRVVGYRIIDEIVDVHAVGKESLATAVKRWYNDATHYTTSRPVGEMVLILRQLDRQ